MEDKERFELYDKVWRIKGQLHQLDKLMEEMDELGKELFKGRTYVGDIVQQQITDQILEEFGDVEICSEQFRNQLKKRGLYTIVEQFKEQKLQKKIEF